jgi:hypothetical protein
MKAKTKPLLLRGINNVLEFGKHKGETIKDIMRTDPNYIHWALRNIPTFKLNRNALLLLPSEVEDLDLNVDHYGDRFPDIFYDPGP